VSENKLKITNNTKKLLIFIIAICHILTELRNVLDLFRLWKVSNLFIKFELKKKDLHSPRYIMPKHVQYSREYGSAHFTAYFGM